MTTIKRYTDINRTAWNEAIPYHQQANNGGWDQAFSASGYITMPDREIELLNTLDLSKKRVAHVCCNNGVELMSLKNMGAKECTGFDICDEAILEAQTRADKLSISCQFVRSDVYDIAEEYYGQFDLVYISAGCLVWMPDIELFFAKIALLLARAGRVFIHEIHPVAQMLALDSQQDITPLQLTTSYFSNTPVIGKGGLDYIGKTQYNSKKFYYFLRTLSELIMAMRKNSLILDHFSEYPDDLSHSLSQVQLSAISVPLSYIMITNKL